MSWWSSPRGRLGLCAAILAGAITSPAAAQIVADGAGFSLTVEGYANGTAGHPFDEASATRDRGRGYGEAALRIYPRLQLGEDRTVGVRLVGQTSTDDPASWGERSLVFTDRWGRIEAGWRQGFPDVLTGYAPNAFQFVSIEFGPASGLSLDPAGGLAPHMLGRAFAAHYGELATLGVSTTFFGDISPKAIYVSPRLNGWLLGASWAPRIERPDAAGHRNNLIQIGIIKERYVGRSEWRFGGSYSYADGQRDGPIRVHALHSLSGGIEYSYDASLYIGASFTWNGDSGLRPMSGGHRASDAFGLATSLNYSTGPWQLGFFAQWAVAEGDTGLRGNDRLFAVQGGGAYRFSRKARLYASLGYYRLDDENQLLGGSPLFLLGARVTL